MLIIYALDTDIKCREQHIVELKRTRQPDDKVLIKEINELAKKKRQLHEMCIACGIKYGPYGKDPTPERAPSAKRQKTTHSPHKEFVGALSSPINMIAPSRTGKEMARATTAPSDLVALSNVQVPGVRAPSSSVSANIPGLDSRATGPSTPPDMILQPPNAPPPINYPSPRAPHNFVEPLTTSPNVPRDQYFGWDGITRAPAGANENLEDIPVQSIEFDDEVIDYSAFINEDYESNLFD